MEKNILLNILNSETDKSFVFRLFETKPNELGGLECLALANSPNVELAKAILKRNKNAVKRAKIYSQRGIHVTRKK